MVLDFTTLIPVGAPVDPAGLGAAINVLAALAGVMGDAAPSLASAATCSIFDGAADAARLVVITGTTGISNFGLHDAGEFRIVRFASAGCVVNHSVSIACVGAANITSEAGTIILVEGDGTNCAVRQIWHPSVLAGVASSLPRGHLFGLGMANNSLDMANDIDINTGEARSSDNTANIVLGVAITKRLDAAWVVGTNQGGLDSGSKANSTTYHVHLISDGGSMVDLLFSTSVAAPSLPSGYTKFRRIGSVITDGAGAIRAFVQVGDDFILATPPLDINAAIGASRSLQALTVPTGIVVTAVVRAINTGATYGVLIQPVDETDAVPSSSASPLYTLGLNGASVTLPVRTNTSRQIAVRASGASSTVRALTAGWTDTRGRLA